MTNSLTSSNKNTAYSLLMLKKLILRMSTGLSHRFYAVTILYTAIPSTYIISLGLSLLRLIQMAMDSHTSLHRGRPPVILLL